MIAIQFERVSKAFDKPVLTNLDLAVREAETKVILGGSGSGKTTILKIILGLVKPDSGRVWVEGHEIANLKEEALLPIRKHIGMVFQEGALFDSLTVRDNVAYRLKEDKDLSAADIEQTVRQVLGFVGLKHTLDKMPSELSGGMRRRVAIARALVDHPRILLYDEPTAGLDPITSRTICDLVIKLRDLEGISSVFVTHDLNSARNLASEFATYDRNQQVVFQPLGERLCLTNLRFVILKDGRILFEGRDEELLASDDQYIREFLT